MLQQNSYSPQIFSQILPQFGSGLFCYDERMEGVRPDRSTHVSRPNYRRYWLALYRRDVPTAERIVNDAIRAWSPQRIYLGLFERALNLSGALFSTGTITYHDEHFITYHTMRFIRRVRRRFVALDPSGPLALAAGIEQESHQIGLRMVCDFLQWANWRIHWLSSNDRATVGQALERLRPAAVLLSLGLGSSEAPASRLIETIRRREYGGLIAIGGGAVNRNPSLVPKLGADLTAPNGLLLVRTLGERMGYRRKS